MATRGWTTSNAVIVPRRALLSGQPTDAAEPYPFTSSLLEGPGALSPRDLTDLALAAGAPRTLVHRGARAAVDYVREAFRRGELVAFRRSSSRAGQAAGSLVVAGSFSDLPDAHASAANENGWDAETRYLLEWNARWSFRRAGKQSLVTMSITAERQSLQTTYFAGAQRSSRHSRHGTLGAHEDLHKRAARTWWTTQTLQEIAARECIAFELILPGSISNAELKARCQRQLDAVREFMTSLHQHHQESTLDSSSADPPTFAGMRR